MWLLILLLLLLRSFIKGTFEYEKITRKEMRNFTNLFSNEEREFGNEI